MAALLLAAGTAQAASVFDHPVTAEQLLRDLGPMTATLREANTLRGSFTQKKILSGVPRPLLAEGSFLFAREHGMAWRTLKPFESELVLTKSEIIQRESAAPAGSTTLRMPAGRAGTESVAGIFFAVFALDFKTLESFFVLHSRRIGAAPSVPRGFPAVTSAGDNNSFSMTPAAAANAKWELGLLPRPGMGDAIKRIVVSGAAQVERVVLHDRHGDETDIHLRDTAASAEPLTAAEERRFKP